MDSTFVLVTWGGDNDAYKGTTPSGVNVPEFSFVEQASLASKYYEAQPAVSQAYCRGQNLGHAWLPINAWFIDTLLAHPKGSAASPTGSRSFRRARHVQRVRVRGRSPARHHVRHEHDGRMSGELPADGRLHRRESHRRHGDEAPARRLRLLRDVRVAAASRSASRAAPVRRMPRFSCFQQAQSTAQCGGGIEGSFPLMGAVDKCCKGRTDSTFCVGLCTSINTNDAASAFFPVCQTIAP